jgi:hypothetical protein
MRRPAPGCPPPPSDDATAPASAAVRSSITRCWRRWRRRRAARCRARHFAPTRNRSTRSARSARSAGYAPRDPVGVRRPGGLAASFRFRAPEDLGSRGRPPPAHATCSTDGAATIGRSDRRLALGAGRTGPRGVRWSSSGAGTRPRERGRRARHRRRPRLRCCAREPATPCRTPLAAEQRLPLAHAPGQTVVEAPETARLAGWRSGRALRGCGVRPRPTVRRRGPSALSDRERASAVSARILLRRPRPRTPP